VYRLTLEPKNSGYPDQVTKVAVTGGAGFVGTNLVLRLISEGHEVVVVDDFSTGLKSNVEKLDCRVDELSFVNEAALEKSIKGCEWIFHLGARGSVPRSIKNPQATFEANTVGTLNVLNTARKFGSRLVFSSSSSVYGRNLELPKCEESWMAPLTPYAASKLSGEALVQSYAESFEIPAVTFRFFNIFGPWQRPDHDYAAVIPKWIWKAIRNEGLEVFGDGDTSRDFTYVDSVVDVLTSTLKRKFSYPTPINLAFGNNITLNHLIEQIKGIYPHLQVTYSPERKGDVRGSQNDPTLIKQLFPEVKPVSFEEGIRKTNEWLVEFGYKVAGQGIQKD
jgi:UDP-glucose 4-epimerase